MNLQNEQKRREECTLSDEELLELMRPKGSSLEKGLVDLCESILSGQSADMIEIGSFVGSSSKIFSRYVRSIVCVDSWRNYFEDQSLNENLEHLFKKNVKDLYNVIKVKGDSLSVAKKFLDNNVRFDFIYIDADHNYEAVKADILHWSKLLKPDGILAGHDFPWPGVKQAVTDLVGPVKLFPDDSWVRVNRKNLYEE